MNNKQWIYDDGAMKHSCSSFPYAYKFMFNALRKWTESGKNYHDLAKRSSIFSPVGKEYSYKDATDLAKSSGLLLSDGTLNSKEFKNRK
jgi:hypothetical protein